MQQAAVHALWRTLCCISVAEKFTCVTVTSETNEKKKTGKKPSLTIIFTLTEKKGTQKEQHLFIQMAEHTLNKLMHKLAMINACVKCGYLLCVPLHKLVAEL